MTETTTKLLGTATSLPAGVTFDKRRNLYRARTLGTPTLHLGYFKNAKLAAKAVKVSGLTVEKSRKVNKHRVRVEGKHIGYFKTRTEAVLAALNVA